MAALLGSLLGTRARRTWNVTRTIGYAGEETAARNSARRDVH